MNMGSEVGKLDGKHLFRLQHMYKLFTQLIFSLTLILKNRVGFFSAHSLISLFNGMHQKEEISSTNSLVSSFHN